jgi:hypothetical protein
MSMNAVELKDKIILKMNNEAGSAANANKKFGDAVLEYICDKMDITYSWSASNPNTGAQDPVTSFKATISGSGTLPVSGSFPLFLVALATLIKTALTISAPSGFVVAPLAYNPIGVITAVMAMETSQDAAMTNFCTQLIASLVGSFPNPASASGTHGAFTGSTTGMVIA